MYLLCGYYHIFNEFFGLKACIVTVAILQALSYYNCPYFVKITVVFKMRWEMNFIRGGYGKIIGN